MSSPTAKSATMLGKVLRVRDKFRYLKTLQIVFNLYLKSNVLYQDAQNVSIPSEVSLLLGAVLRMGQMFGFS